MKRHAAIPYSNFLPLGHTEGMTKLRLIVDEPMPGSFFWALVESDEGATSEKEVQAAEAAADSYEAALAAGTRALQRRVHHQDSQETATH